MEAPPPAPGRRGRRPQRSIRDSRAALLYLAPALALFLLFIAWPVIRNVQTSFYGNSELDPVLRPVGLDNFGWMASDPGTQRAFVNVALFFVMTVPVQMLLGLLLALALQGRGWFRAALRVFLFLPVVLTPVVVGFLFAELLETTNGPVNTSLRAVGLDGLAQAWLAEPQLGLPVVAGVNVWMWTGFSMVLYQAAITGLDSSVLEAGRLDGATGWRLLSYVIVPLLRPAHFSLLVLGVIGTLKTFDLVYVLTGGGVDHSSDVPTTILLDELLNGRDGRAAAIGTAVFAVALLVTAVQLWRYQRREEP